MSLIRRAVLQSLGACVAAASATRTVAGDEGPMEAAYREFLAASPDWEGTRHVDELRRREYPRLASSGEAYLDYTGASLHADSQVDRHAELLRTTLLGNPHSRNQSSRNATRLVEAARAAVRSFFGASADDYEVIFTPNATGALRLVGECYPFDEQHGLLLTQDNHNSVNGIAEFAKHEGAPVRRVPLTVPELRLDRDAVAAALDEGPNTAPGLFAFPAQSNFSGVRHPLELVGMAKSAGWQVLLDAAAFAPTNALNLATCRPDFVCVSFYKMFGYPTGVGCLLVRRESTARWRRDWYSGGNVKLASVAAGAFVPAEDAAAFEDGTIDFLSLPAVTIGLEHLAAVGMETIGTRVRCLTSWTLDRIRALRHRSGRAVVRLLGPENTTDRGGTIAFALHDTEGRSHDIRAVCELAAGDGIGLRSGFFCNPGAGEAAFGLTGELLKPIFAAHRDLTFDDLRTDIRRVTGGDVGALRASFGIVSDFTDAWRLCRFLERFVDTTTAELGTAPRGS